jgi:hypothetical protein
MLRLFRPKPNKAQKAKSYWDKRKHMFYFQHVRTIVHFTGRDAKSLIDIGTQGCPYLEWFDWIPTRVSVDLDRPYRSETVQGVQADFLTYHPGKRFDFALCLQVLEHIPDVERFAQKLLHTADHVLISVPYCWPAGQCKSHIHDPIDFDKVLAWFRREPDFHMISKELKKTERLICYWRLG